MLKFDYLFPLRIKVALLSSQAMAYSPTPEMFIKGFGYLNMNWRNTDMANVTKVDYDGGQRSFLLLPGKAWLDIGQAHWAKGTQNERLRLAYILYH